MVSNTNLAASNTTDPNVLKSFIQDENAIISEKKGPHKRSSGKNRRHQENGNGSSLRQVTAAFIANLGTINTGMTMGFSAVAIPQLMDTNSTLLLTAQEASWVASLSSIGTQCGCILSAYLTDLLGRKRTLILTDLPAIVGWIIIAVAPTTEWIYIGRILTGVSSGMVGAPSRVYTAEVSQPHLRGILSALASVGASFGVAFEYIVGSMCSWKALAWISSIIPILSICTSFLLPESPSWLVSSGQKHKCFNSLKKLRGSTCDVVREVNTLVEFSERHHSNVKMTAKEKLRIIFNSSILKPFLILISYFFIYQMSGSNPLTFYAVMIFDDFGIKNKKYLFTVLIGITRLAFTIFGCVLMLHCRRRTLTFISTIGCGITMLILGFYGFFMENFKEFGQVEPFAVWIPISSIFLFVIASTVGYLIVPWVMIGELYPAHVRGLVGGLTTTSCHLFIFIAVKTYPLLREWLSMYGPFFIYGAISLFGTIFLYVYLPETKDKSLQEIEEHFSSNKLKKVPVEKEKHQMLTTTQTPVTAV